MGKRHVSLTQTATRLPGMKTYRCTQRGETSQSHTPGLPTALAWTRGGRHTTTHADAPTPGACCPVWPLPLGIQHSSWTWSTRNANIIIVANTQGYSVLDFPLAS